MDRVEVAPMYGLMQPRPRALTEKVILPSSNKLGSDLGSGRGSRYAGSTGFADTKGAIGTNPGMAEACTGTRAGWPAGAGGWAS